MDAEALRLQGILSEAYGLLDQALGSIRCLRAKHSVTSVELEIEEFLGRFGTRKNPFEEEEENPFL